jgi:hypothetical protein
MRRCGKSQPWSSPRASRFALGGPAERPERSLRPALVSVAARRMDDDAPHGDLCHSVPLPPLDVEVPGFGRAYPTSATEATALCDDLTDALPDTGDDTAP